VGYHNLPKDMLGKVLDFDCVTPATQGYIRPPLCSVKVHACKNI